MGLSLERGYSEARGTLLSIRTGRDGKHGIFGAKGPKFRDALKNAPRDLALEIVAQERFAHNFAKKYGVETHLPVDVVLASLPPDTRITEKDLDTLREELNASLHPSNENITVGELQLYRQEDGTLDLKAHVVEAPSRPPRTSGDPGTAWEDH